MRNGLMLIGLSRDSIVLDIGLLGRSEQELSVFRPISAEMHRKEGKREKEIQRVR